MSEMVQRVARAIATEYAHQNRMMFERRQHTVDAAALARAAIEAMREPTKAMEDAGIETPNAINPSCDHEWIINPGRIWRAMIDAARAPREGEPTR